MAQSGAGFPLWEVRFDEDGRPVDHGAVDAILHELPGKQLTDLFVFSHGWNNDPATARDLYGRFFAALRDVEGQLGQPATPRGRPAVIGTLGIIWPSMRWIDEESPAGGGAAGLAGQGQQGQPVSDAQLVLALKAAYTKPAQQKALDELADLLQKRPAEERALLRFQELMAILTPGPHASGPEEDSGERNLLTADPKDTFLRLGSQAPAPRDQGGAAGWFDPFRRLWGQLWEGGKQALRQATYWEMKNRAGVVGQHGLAPLVVRLNQAQPQLRVHLLGHSFGARLVSFALAGLPAAGPSPVKSLVLLQGAFSHFAFAVSLPFAPMRSGALAGMQARVDGPLAVTHSLKDTAVGVYYPLASASAGQGDAGLLEDFRSRWGAMGYDGAQAVSALSRALGPVGQADLAGLPPGQFVNLDGDQVIVAGGPPSGAHSDIVHPQIAWAVLALSGIAGQAAAAASAGGAATLQGTTPAAQPTTAPAAATTTPPTLLVTTISEAFKIPEQQKEERKQAGLRERDDLPSPVMVELNLFHAQGVDAAIKRLEALYTKLTNKPAKDLERIANTYFRCQLSVNQVGELVRLDQSDEGKEVARRAIYRIWPDYPIHPLIDRSVTTIKADAARRSYDACGAEITWAVIDSGIDENHPHFAPYQNLKGDVAELHRDFTMPRASDSPVPPDVIQSALTDGDLGHGTHVAGIIAGSLLGPPGATPPPHYVGQHIAPDGENAQIELRTFGADQLGGLAGVAPRCKLVSLKVLGPSGQSRSSDVIRALQYIREQVNGNGKLLRVQGVNLSLGYEFNAKWFACGQSPICVEVDRLVRSGVVVVIAAGNTGYGTLQTVQRLTETGMSLTINDPGNANLAITVGSTHRDKPHTYGVSFFSSKGPTGDGRLKPDLVAPGERITSCAAGPLRKQMAHLIPVGAPATQPAAYIDDSGTSMAAPHVSGAIAAFLSIRREFIGQPEKVKEIFLKSATSLGRERYFEGNGLVDLMRAIQSV